MSNTSIHVRAKRWAKFLKNYLKERVHGLDFSMVYVGDLQRNVEEFHGYSMTDADDMKWMLGAVPVDPRQSAFLDVGCGKGMCLKCAAEMGYKKVAGLDLDEHLLGIAQSNMKKLKLDGECILGNAVEFDRYAEFDVFYFYHPFGRHIFEQVIKKILASQKERNREIWAVYYHPGLGELFEQAGFETRSVIHDTTRDTITKIFYYPKRENVEA